MSDPNAGRTIPGRRKLELGAGKPRITELIKDGKIRPEDIDPSTGLPRTPQAPLVTETVTSEDGTTREVQYSRGYVKNPDNPSWRIGLTPEKYLEKIRAELDFELRKGRREKVAPDLYPEEIEDFLPWLEKFAASDPADGVPDHPTIARYLKEIEKRAAKKGKGKGPKDSPAPDASV